MKPLADAQREVLDAMRPLPAERVGLADALGLVLADPVTAPHPVPPFANSGVDGYAVRAADTGQPPVTLEVVEDVPAGRVPSESVGPGRAIRIMTGAMIPDGADAVVMVEDTVAAGDEVTITAAAATGAHVRPAGGDLEAGALVFDAGERLSPSHLGVLASIGVAEPVVHRRPVVAVMSTGDELAPAGAAPLQPGGIRDSNRPMLTALLADLGATVLDLGIIPDDEARLRSAFDDAQEADAVISSGGVSMGEHDLVKSVLAGLGTVDFWRVAMQPGKPFAFGSVGDVPFFGLPGNPVSVGAAFEQFVRPALLTRMGAARIFRPRSTVEAGEAFATDPEKTVFLRVVVDDSGGGRPVARLAGGQASNVLTALAAADGFAVIPVGVAEVAPGDPVEVEWFGAVERRTRKEALGG